MTETNMDNMSCRVCGNNMFNIGTSNFGRMFIMCIECGDIFLIGPGLTVSGIINLLRRPKECNVRKEDILYRIAKQEYPICIEGFQCIEPIKNREGELDNIKIIFEDEKNIELRFSEYGNIIEDYLRFLNIKEWECGDCRKTWLDHAKEVVDEDTGSICPICGSGTVGYMRKIARGNYARD